MTNLILWNGMSKSTGPSRTIGAYQIAHWARKHGYTARVIDFCPLIDPKKIAEITLNWCDKNTIAVGVTSSWWTKKVLLDSGSVREIQSWEEPDWLIEARSLVEEKNQSISWICGGGAVIKRKYKLNWHKVFFGHAEDDLIKWLDSKQNRISFKSFFDIKNLDHRFIKDDCIRPEETLPIELGRGCKFKCKFCQYPLIGKIPGTYIRNIQCVKEEIIYNYENWGTTKYFFIDDTVNEDEEKIKNLMIMTQSLPFQIQWVGFNRADLIYAKPHTAQWLLDSGLKSTFFGIESFNREASKIIGKGWSGVNGKEWIPILQNDLWRNNVTLSIAFIAGLDAESEEDLWNTHNWCIENKIADWHFSVLTILKTENERLWSSEFDKEYEKYGYSFPEISRPWYWVSKNWNFDSAWNVTKKLLKESKCKKIAGWQLFESSNLNYNLDFLSKQGYYFSESKDFKLRSQQFLDRYCSTLLSLND
jgi:radical SAM superfamily enzyme YgiQ (UPF0313 family)